MLVGFFRVCARRGRRMESNHLVLVGFVRVLDPKVEGEVKLET
jgi:hypothetical protein